MCGVNGVSLCPGQRSSEVCEARLGESRDQPEMGREQLGQENRSQGKGTGAKKTQVKYKSPTQSFKRTKSVGL